MISAHFIVNGEEREARGVTEEWLERAAATHENVLLHDGNTYIVKSVDRGADGHARVELVPPQFARGS
jgi:hypothetical protein